MNPIFTIRFGKSKSPSYQDVLKRCRKFGDFTEGDMNTLLINDFNEVIKLLYDFGEIVGIASGWKSFSMLYRDHEVKSPANYKTVAGNVARCTYAKVKSNDPHYCTLKDKIPTWGCRLINFIGKDPFDYCIKWWYEYGHFTSDLTYEIDKTELLIALKEESRDKMIDNCPFFKENKMIRQIELLPDQIYITDTDNWRVDYKPIFIGQKQFLVPISIHHINRFEKLMTTDGEEYRETMKPDLDTFDLLVNLDKIDNAAANKIIEQYLKNKRYANKNTNPGSENS